MQELATVVSTENSKAVVSVSKKDECSKCGMCLFPPSARSVEFNAENSVGAKVGDTVLIDVKDEGKLTALILVFLVPILLILVSSLIAEFVIKSEMWMLYLSLISLVGWFCILPQIDKILKKKRKFTTEIISITKTKGE